MEPNEANINARKEKIIFMSTIIIICPMIIGIKATPPIITRIRNNVSN